MKTNVIISLLCMSFALCACKKKKANVENTPGTSRKAIAAKRTQPRAAKVAPRKRVVAKKTVAKAGPPAQGIVTKFEQGDLACYVFLKDAKGKEHNLSGDFALCSKNKKFIGKKVALQYRKQSMPNCPADMKCKPKNKIVDLVIKLTFVK